MIKRTYLLTILLIVCLLTGCGNKTEKMCRIEIRNENSTDVITLEQQSQADVDDFFDEDEWTECENFDEKLVSEYVIELYQEKTHTRVQPDKENTYEKVMGNAIWWNFSKNLFLILHKGQSSSAGL